MAAINTSCLIGSNSFLPRAAGRVGRFRIPLDGSPFGELDTTLDPEEHGRGINMCSINPAYLGKRYRYAYACGARRPCNFPNTLTVGGATFGHRPKTRAQFECNYKVFCRLGKPSSRRASSFGRRVTKTKTPKEKTKISEEWRRPRLIRRRLRCQRRRQ